MPRNPKEFLNFFNKSESRIWWAYHLIWIKFLRKFNFSNHKFHISRGLTRYFLDVNFLCFSFVFRKFLSSPYSPYFWFARYFLFPNNIWTKKYLLPFNSFLNPFSILKSPYLLHLSSKNAHSLHFIPLFPEASSTRPKYIRHRFNQLDRVCCGRLFLWRIKEVDQHG